MSSSRLSSRPSQHRICPWSAMNGCFSTRDSRLVWSGRYTIAIEPDSYSLRPSGPQRPSPSSSALRITASTRAPSKQCIPAIPLTSFSPFLQSAPVEHFVYLLNSGSVIDDFVIYFHPSMDQERKFLTSDDQLRRYPTTPQQVCRDGGPLQAHSLLRIPGQRSCNSIVDLANRVAAKFLVAYRPVSDKVVKSVETYQFD